MLNWPIYNQVGDERRYLSFWGSQLHKGGCCYSHYEHDSPLWGRNFELRWCEAPPTPPQNLTTPKPKCTPNWCPHGYKLKKSEELPEYCGCVECTTAECCDAVPVDCVWGEWSRFGACTAQCDGGRKVRTRQFAVLARNGGAPCQGSPEDIQVCNDEPCPVDCEWSVWSEWGKCSVTCGAGVNSRKRHIVVQAANGGTECGCDSGTRPCNMGECPCEEVLVKDEGSQATAPPTTPTEPTLKCAGGCCTSPAGWVSIGNSDCAIYGSFDMCTKSGSYGSGWIAAYGTFKQWSNNGIDATQACCECGGGVKV